MYKCNINIYWCTTLEVFSTKIEKYILCIVYKNKVYREIDDFWWLWKYEKEPVNQWNKFIHLCLSTNNNNNSCVYCYYYVDVCIFMCTLSIFYVFYNISYYNSFNVYLKKYSLFDFSRMDFHNVTYTIILYWMMCYWFIIHNTLVILKTVLEVLICE